MAGGQDREELRSSQIMAIRRGKDMIGSGERNGRAGGKARQGEGRDRRK
jgi:hypothetical protein